MAADITRMTIALENLRLYGFHGVLPQERKVGAEYELNIEILLPMPDACVTDNLSDTVSYADVYALVSDLFAKPVELLEHLAYTMARAVLNRWQVVEGVNIKVTKLAPPIPGCLGNASVSLSLSRDSYCN